MAGRKGYLVSGSVYQTRTAAGHFAQGYRGKRFGRAGKPRGSVRVGPVGKYWGVFDHDPQKGSAYISVAKGIEYGRRTYGRR